jgi:hypothetical protein
MVIVLSLPEIVKRNHMINLVSKAYSVKDLETSQAVRAITPVAFCPVVSLVQCEYQPLLCYPNTALRVAPEPVYQAA